MRVCVLGDQTCDLRMNVSDPDQYIVWAVGGFDTTAFRHFERSDRKTGRCG